MARCAKAVPTTSSCAGRGSIGGCSSCNTRPSRKTLATRWTSARRSSFAGCGKAQRLVFAPRERRLVDHYIDSLPIHFHRGGFTLGHQLEEPVFQLIRGARQQLHKSLRRFARLEHPRLPSPENL